MSQQITRKSMAKTRTNLDGKWEEDDFTPGDPILYHCQDPGETAGQTLCGVNSPAEGAAYDFAEYYFREDSMEEPDYNWHTRTHHELVRCPKCMAHPDVPLMLLGVL